jgi:exonuclease SbcC
MQAFGSYGNPETIDFNELGEHRLFLIHGPTGSGKTTVLDAMCFALYGDATVVDRDAKGFRSDFAAPTEITEVTFDFAIGERTFRIVRRPEQERAKIRGEGMTKSPVAATMWERTEVGEDHEGTVLASKWSDVTNKVEELLGFRSDQFRQVIVLPQGRFRDLLMASSKDREEILQQLFDTSFYRQIQISLKDQARSIAAEVKDQRTRRSVLLEQCDCTDEKELAELIEELEKDLETQERVAKKAGKDSKAAQKALTEAAGLDKRFVLQEQITKAISQFQKESAAIDATRAKLEEAKKAASLTDFFATVNEARQAAKDRKSELELAQSIFKESKKAVEKARKALQKHKGEEGQRKRLEKAITELERIRPIVAELARKQAECDKANSEFKTADTELKQLLNSKKGLKKDIESANTQIKKLQGRLRDRELLQKELQEAEKRRDGMAVLAKKRQVLATAEKVLKAATTAGRKAGKQIESKRMQLQVLVDQRHAGSAALLASDLQPGEECPVCGSTDHPNLASSGQELPDNEAIEEARSEVVAAEEALDEENRKVRKADSAFATLKGELDTLIASLGDEPETSEGLEEAVQGAKEKLNEHDQLSALLEEQTKHIQRLEKNEVKNESDIEVKQKSHAKLSKKVSAAEATLAELQKSAGKDFQNQDDIDFALEEAEEELNESREAFEKAQENERKLSSEMTKAETALKHAREASDSSTKEVGSREKKWQERLEKVGFSSEKAYRASELSEQSQTELQNAIETHDRDFAEAKVRAQDIAKDLKGKERPEISVLKKVAEKSDAARSAADAAVVAIREKIKSLESTRMILKKLGKDLSALEEQYGVLGTLANTADGQNSLRVSLQRFVLATRLDDVLIAASQRLAMMTKGRYRIQRNTAADDKRAAGGLELEVEDAYTGSCRPVSTLSGGESFQAALALALGLSEVVQAYAGGIRLDTIFVDEGFGSLDQEALELAINTLIDLQASGRMVGIISHVPELKERIDVRLQIKSGRAGSTATFRLP